VTALKEKTTMAKVIEHLFHQTAFRDGFVEFEKGKSYAPSDRTAVYLATGVATEIEVEQKAEKKADSPAETVYVDGEGEEFAASEVEAFAREAQGLSKKKWAKVPESERKLLIATEIEARSLTVKQ
jgi:hypothetical protein